MLSVVLETPAFAVGVAGGVGMSVVDDIDKKYVEPENSEFSSKPMIGPLVSVSLRGGDWVDHQLLVQFRSTRGPVLFESETQAESAEGTLGFSSIGVGYQLGLDIFGKEGRHRLSPCLAVGFVVGSAGLRLRAHSDNPDLQDDLEEEGFDDRRDRLTYVTLHALLGLRVRVSDEVGVRAVVARTTTGGLWMWEPQLVVDFTPRKTP